MANYIKPIKKLSWEQVEQAVQELGGKIEASGFEPDYVIGIASGGLIPLGLLAQRLDIDSILTLSATSYEKDKQKKLAITYLPEIDLAGKKVLLVDEIADTGRTLEAVSETIREKYKVKELKSATIAVNEGKCKFFPDFVAVKEPSEWIVFPWEKGDFPEYFSE